MEGDRGREGEREWEKREREIEKDKKKNAPLKIGKNHFMSQF